MDEGTKFINKETIQFLRNKAGSTVTQQLENIRERIDIESKDLDEMVKRQVTDRLAIDSYTSQLDYLGSAFSSLQVDVTNLKYSTSLATKVLDKTSKQIKWLAIALTALAVGVAVCLVRSLT